MFFLLGHRPRRRLSFPSEVPITFDIRDPEYRKNPYTVFRRLRAEAPVCRMEPFGHWAIARYADVERVLRNAKTFASSGISDERGEGPELLMNTRAMIGADPPEHTRLRNLVNRAFTPAMVTRLEPRIRLLARGLIAEMKKKDEFDFVGDFSMPLPVIVIAELLGLDPARREDFKRWTDTLLTWRSRGKEAVYADLQQMFDYFTATIAERRARPSDDLISALVLACDEGQKLSGEEVMAFVRLLLVAGSETTTNLLSNAVVALMAYPKAWEAIRRNRALIPNCVEEALRFDGPVISLSRRVTRDVEIAGTLLRAGEFVLPLLASANHDEAKFPHGDRFDITRNPQGHFSFSTGIHFCLGAPLARLQARVALEELTEAFGGFYRPEPTLDYLGTFFFRGLKTLRLAEYSI